jgi:hypothetical protein
MQQKGTLKTLQSLHMAMLSGQIAIAIVAMFLKYRNELPLLLSDKDHLLQLITLAVSFAGVFFGATIFKKRVAKAKELTGSINAKAKQFRCACIIQWASIEAPSLLSVICFMMVGNYAFIALTAGLMLWFALTGPSKMKTMLLLGLSETEMENF